MKPTHRHVPEDRNPHVNSSSGGVGDGGGGGGGGKFSCLYCNGILLSRNAGAEHPLGNIALHVSVIISRLGSGS